MVKQKVQRKLTAILSADVKGYSRLMREDEISTVATLKAYREVMSILIEEHRGRVVDSPGDNVLAEFTSVVDGIECAVEIQKELKVKNADLPENRRMEFRIGVNLGDVIEDGERIYGDGVNIAARVEGLAEAAGICISGTVYEHIKDKLALGYESLGEQTVKNIAEPVRVYRILMEPEAIGSLVRKDKRGGLKRWQWAAVGLVMVFLLVAGVVWNTYFRLPSVEGMSEGPMAFDLPDGPTVAVLPFVNMSGDPEQEYFSDGLTENIITGLSGCPKLFVIARNSTFTYKGKPVKVQQVAKELGVRYVVEGSVQKAGDRVRITVQLIDAATAHHLWAEKYDRDLGDIFALQDEIAIKIMTALQVELTEGEQARLRLQRCTNLEAYMKGLKGLEYIRRENKDDNIRARREAEEAIALAPEESGFYTLLAYTHIMDLWLGSKNPLFSMMQASKSVNKAIALDENSSDAYFVLSHLHLMRKQHEKAIVAAERAVVLNPNGADAYCNLAYILHMSGRSAEAIGLFKKAFHLNPFPAAAHFVMLGESYHALGRYEEAIDVYKKAIDREPTGIFAHLGLAAAYIKVGLHEEARIEAAEIYSLDPKFSLEDCYDPHINENYVKELVDTYRKAGLK